MFDFGLFALGRPECTASVKTSPFTARGQAHFLSDFRVTPRWPVAMIKQSAKKMCLPFALAVNGNPKIASIGARRMMEFRFWNLFSWFALKRNSI